MIFKRPVQTKFNLPISPVNSGLSLIFNFLTIISPNEVSNHNPMSKTTINMDKVKRLIDQEQKYMI